MPYGIVQCAMHSISSGQCACSETRRAAANARAPSARASLHAISRGRGSSLPCRRLCSRPRRRGQTLRPPRSRLRHIALRIVRVPLIQCAPERAARRPERAHRPAMTRELVPARASSAPAALPVPAVDGRSAGRVAAHRAPSAAPDEEVEKEENEKIEEAAAGADGRRRRRDAGRSAPADAPMLHTLPEELVLRIVAATGGAREQMRHAFVLGAVCTRLRAVLQAAFLPSLSELGKGQLEALTLSDPPCARAALQAMLQRATALRHVCLSCFSPEVFTPTCFAAMAASCGAHLRVVNLAYSLVTDAAVRPLMRCPVLEELSLYGCSKINGAAFAEPARRAPMHVLDLSFMHGLSQDALKHVSRFAHTQHLSLMGCSALNSTGIATLAAGPIAQSLRSIALNFCPIDDQCLVMLIEAAPKLTKLTLAKHTENLWDTGQYTQATIDNLTSRFRNLNIVVEN